MSSRLPPVPPGRGPLEAWFERAINRPARVRLAIITASLVLYLLAIAVLEPGPFIWLSASIPVALTAFHFPMWGVLGSWTLTFVLAQFTWWPLQRPAPRPLDAQLLLIFAFVLVSGTLINALSRYTRHQRELLHSLELVQFTSAAITGIPNFRPLAEELLERLAGRLGARLALLLLVDERTGILRAEVAFNPSPDLIKRFDGLQVRMSDVAPLAQLEQHRVPVVAESSPTDWWQHHTLGPTGAGMLLAVPLLGEHRTIGAIVVFGTRRTQFRSDEITMASTVANHLAIALETARRHADTHRQVVTDSLTGLYNRRFLDERLPEEWGRATRHQTSLSLMILDLDHFKTVNDTHGHPAGDEILRQFARVIEQQTRAIDLRTRHGGEEFVVILPLTDRESAYVVAERLRQAVQQHRFQVGDLQLRLTVSVGIATNGPGLHSAQQLFQAADDALYTAKAWGRNRVCMAKTEPAGLAET
ncbi:MAG TPA: hypothetical protein DEP84_13395 [Chloroflexi bacterium]|nr:hypothetical protein [Chloroflexota bacterium]